MKLKTIKEIGKFTDMDIEIYNRVKSIKNKRAKLSFIHDSYSIPIVYFLCFGVIAISFIISGFFIYSYLMNDLHLIIIKPNITYNETIGLYFSLGVICAIPVIIFTIAEICIGCYARGKEQEKNIEDEIYEKPKDN